MARAILTLLCLILLATAASAGDPDEFSGVPLPPKHDELLLKDGTLLRGEILEEREDLVVFQTDALGRLEISRDRIARLAHADRGQSVRQDPDVNSLMFCPTPATLPSGSGYFRSFELFFLNFGYAPADDVNLSVATLFPVTGDVLMLSVGAKVRMLDRATGPLGLALTGSYTTLEETRFGSVGVVAGVGDPRSSFNVALSRNFQDDGDAETVILVGADIQGRSRIKFFAEWMSSSALFADDADDLDGFLNLGLRLFGTEHSFSISGFRPLLDDDSGFIAFPMIMYSSHW